MQRKESMELSPQGKKHFKQMINYYCLGILSSVIFSFLLQFNSLDYDPSKPILSSLTILSGVLVILSSVLFLYKTIQTHSDYKKHEKLN